MSAKDRLEGLTLPSGWKVLKRLTRSVMATGGSFSTSYLAERNGQRGFLKAMDFSNAFRENCDTARELQLITAAYNNERDILDHCRDRRMSNIVLALDHGEAHVSGMGTMEGRVFYLVFELATGDVRCQMDELTAHDALWCMRVLRDACLGLWQIHKEMIAHQDLKPSNVLTYRHGVFKVADFGRSSRRGQPTWIDELKVAGDRRYAPPELLYGFTHNEFAPRRIGCDLYMLGNLASFLFSGVNVTPSLIERLNTHHRPKHWSGSYSEVLPYLQDSFSQVLESLQPRVDVLVRSEVIALARELCNPDLARRGHPKGIGRRDQFSLERYVSRLDLVTRRAETELRIQRRSA